MVDAVKQIVVGVCRALSYASNLASSLLGGARALAVVVSWDVDLRASRLANSMTFL